MNLIRSPDADSVRTSCTGVGVGVGGEPRGDARPGLDAHKAAGGGLISVAPTTVHRLSVAVVTISSIV